MVQSMELQRVGHNLETEQELMDFLTTVGSRETIDSF